MELAHLWNTISCRVGKAWKGFKRRSISNLLHEREIVTIGPPGVLFKPRALLVYPAGTSRELSKLAGIDLYDMHRFKVKECLLKDIIN